MGCSGVGMSDSPTLRDMAVALDDYAIEMTKEGDHEEALAAVTLAMALESRHRQTLDVGWPKS